MVDMNDPEVIESLKFLAVSKEEKIATGARPFDSKKNVFVPDHKEGFLEAEIQSTDEAKGTVTAKTCKGEVNYLNRKMNLQKFNFLFSILKIGCYSQSS
jgi:hypothetical protein